MLCFQLLLSLNAKFHFFCPLIPRKLGILFSMFKRIHARSLIHLLSLVLGLYALTGCSSPAPEDRAWISPDATYWVHAVSVPPAPGSDDLLTTQELVVHQRWNPRTLVLVGGLESLCGTELKWLDATHLGLRLSLGDASKLQIKDGDQWGDLQFRVILHEDLVSHQVWSPDGQRCLVVIHTCMTDDWNLYLRRKGEPLYNAAMDTGWDDPDVLGGFGYTQPPIYLKWTGPRSAEIAVPGKSYQVTLRDHAGDVKVHWKFIASYKVPTPITGLAPKVKASKTP
jgi:hypothetical protein